VSLANAGAPSRRPNPSLVPTVLRQPKPGWAKLIRVDYHGAKEVPTGTCHAILKAAGIKQP
jgi:predicted RNA binding protein YcfA (HicA-like mRNA interferase family)